MRIFRFVSIFLALFPLAFSFGTVEAATYYIDGSNGNDNNPGSILVPWKSLNKANITLQAGDTVHIRAGTYDAEGIAPSNSGSPGNYITYKNYDSESVTLSKGYYQAHLMGKNYIIIDGITFYNASARWIILEDANHNIIKNCTFDTSHGYYGLQISPNGNGSHYNQFLNNTFKDAPSGFKPENTSPTDLFGIKNGSYNLISGNTFGKASHVALLIAGSTATYNVIRNNTFQNPFHHNIASYRNNPWNLFEGNKIYDAGADWTNNPNPFSASRQRLHHNGLQHGASNSIIRRNVFVNNGQGITVGGGSSNAENMIYHNTFYVNQSAVGNDAQTLVENNKFINNTFSDGVQFNIYHHQMSPSQGINLWLNSNVDQKAITKYQWKESQNIIDIESEFPSEWMGSVSVDPQFSNPALKDFSLKSTSFLIDKGTWLTTIRSATAMGQTSFTVKDANFFYDGWTIPDEIGDKIKTENGAVTTISRIDYDTNTIIVNPAIDIVNGEGLALHYFGLAPDIGAYEYEGTSGLLSRPQNLRVK